MMSATPPGRPLPIFALGFRPFFLAAGAYALASMAIWAGMLLGWAPPNFRLGGALWHAHEMLFGYTAAVLAGFLLTAVRNWSGIETPSGAPLALLVGLWLAARAATFLPVPGVVAAALDIAFFPALAVGLFRPLWSGTNRVNRVFLALLAGMTVASLLVHLQATGVIQGTAPHGTRLMLDLTLLTLLIVSGRVMPFFTERGIPGARPRVRPFVERLTFVLAPTGLILNLTLPWSELAGAIALSLAALQAIRLAGWHDPRVWRIPILAVLYTGYLWLVVGLALDGLVGFGLIQPFPALHALTVGAVGVFTLGMMARVSLGHTGREMRSTAATNLAFVSVNAAALTRVIPAILFPSLHTPSLLVSASLWILAFALFLWVYAPTLLAPRVDGRPG